MMGGRQVCVRHPFGDCLRVKEKLWRECFELLLRGDTR